MRLIDAESLDILSYLEEFPESEEDKAWNMAVRAIYDYVNSADTICSNPNWEQEPCHGRTEHYCSLHKGLAQVERETFCSYGERR